MTRQRGEREVCDLDPRGGQKRRGIDIQVAHAVDRVAQEPDAPPAERPNRSSRPGQVMHLPHRRGILVVPRDEMELPPVAQKHVAQVLHAVHPVVVGDVIGPEARPDLNWDVRRFRPNLVVDVADGIEPFGEQRWLNRRLRVGTAVLSVGSPTVRCAMPLRAQPDGLARQPGLFAAMNELNPDHPNHLGLYLQVVNPGTIAVGDRVHLEG